MGEKKGRKRLSKKCTRYTYMCHAIKFEYGASAFTACSQKTTNPPPSLPPPHERTRPHEKYNMIYLPGADRNSAMLHSLLTTNDVSSYSYSGNTRILEHMRHDRAPFSRIWPRRIRRSLIEIDRYIAPTTMKHRRQFKLLAFNFVEERENVL